jgi:hypothetical protein
MSRGMAVDIYWSRLALNSTSTALAVCGKKLTCCSHARLRYCTFTHHNTTPLIAEQLPLRHAEDCTSSTHTGWRSCWRSTGGENASLHLFPPHPDSCSENPSMVGASGRGQSGHKQTAVITRKSVSQAWTLHQLLGQTTCSLLVYSMALSQLLWLYSLHSA